MSGTAEPLPVLRLQTVLYRTPLAAVWRLAHGIDAAADVAREAGLVSRVEWALGDSGPAPVLDQSSLSDLADACSRLAGVTYDFFGANLGHGGGHNRLSAGHDSGMLLFINPDTYPAPTAFASLCSAVGAEGVAVADARQIPFEHPKAYDLDSGETSWASGACMMVRSEPFAALGGFDAESFFLHCDDVDLSWRMKAAGWRVVTAPSAVVFHDKRPVHGTTWPSTPDSERYFQVLGRLMLATRWSRPDIVAQTIESVTASGDSVTRAALAEYRRRVSTGAVPSPAGADAVAEFVEGEYAVHRF